MARAPSTPPTPDAPALIGDTSSCDTQTVSPKPTLLLVDDDRALARVLSMVLAGAGYEVQIESTVGSAVARARMSAHEFDAVLVDHNLPDGTGADVVQAIRDAGASPGVLLYTGLHPEAAVEAARAVGADAYLRKPKAEGLLRAVAEVVARGRERRNWSKAERSESGNTWFHQDFVRTLERRGPLTKRQAQALALVLSGASHEHTAARMGIRPVTVRNHLKNARAKLGAESVADLIRVYVRARNEAGH